MEGKGDGESRAERVPTVGEDSGRPLAAQRGELK